MNKLEGIWFCVKVVGLVAKGHMYNDIHESKRESSPPRAMRSRDLLSCNERGEEKKRKGQLQESYEKGE